MNRMEITATLTEIRKDGMQKWERTDLDKGDRARYIWLHPYQSLPGVTVGSVGNLAFSKGTGGAIGGHWAVWKLTALLNGGMK